jgi:hypothetical protein
MGAKLDNASATPALLGPVFQRRPKPGGNSGKWCLDSGSPGAATELSSGVSHVHAFMYMPQSCSAKEAPYLDSVILLVPSRYTEFVAHVYSQPVFHFHDPTSFIAFFGSILPECFAIIRRVSFYQTFGFSGRGIRRHLPTYALPDVFSDRGDYSFLHDQAVVIRNPILPRLPPIGQERRENDVWDQSRKILRKMPALQEVKISVTYNTWGQCVTSSQDICDHLWLSKDFEEWKFTKIPEEEHALGCPWRKFRDGCKFNGNLYLRRRHQQESNNS